MKLENIGFYTLSDQRAINSSVNSPLYRCELILTDVCNFKCIYCRGLRKDISGTMSLIKAKEIINLWLNEGLKNIRFSGGEPTLYSNLIELVEMCKNGGVEHIAISTNGSANKVVYENLIKAGVNDFSVSLDSCCSSIADKMSGGVEGWNIVVENIKWLSKQVYTTVGIVVNDENIDQCLETILFADSLGVSDIRVIPSAQYNKILKILSQIPKDILTKYPILSYRTNNLINGRHVRGLTSSDSHICKLVLDDMAIAGNYHFPCIIYMREQGDPIGLVGPNMRQEREKWSLSHNCKSDPICSKNCLDVCIDFNNKSLVKTTSNDGDLY